MTQRAALIAVPRSPKYVASPLMLTADGNIAALLEVTDRFCVDHLVATTRFTTLYAGVDRSTGEAVAIKITNSADPWPVRSIAREATSLKVISHPGIPRYIVDGVVADGRPFLIMGWIDGPDLHEVLRGGPLPLVPALRIADAIITTISLVHAAGIIHRDIKPSNILIPRRNGCMCHEHAILIDFNAAYPATSHSRDGVPQTTFGRTSGSGIYMPPEQLTGRAQSAATDVYAIGLLLVEMLTGKVPGTELRLERAAPGVDLPSVYLGPFVLQRVAADIPVDVDECVPTAVAELLRGMLRANPTSRLSASAALTTVRELRSALDV